jgi:hypothetical protein
MKRVSKGWRECFEKEEVRGIVVEQRKVVEKTIGIYVKLLWSVMFVIISQVNKSMFLEDAVMALWLLTMVYQWEASMESPHGSRKYGAYFTEKNPLMHDFQMSSMPHL